jgi:hypothetical protein
MTTPPTMTIESVMQAMQSPVPLWTALVAAAPLALAVLLAVWALHIALRWSQRDSMRRVDLIADVARLEAENEALRAECKRLAKLAYPMVTATLHLTDPSKDTIMREMPGGGFASLAMLDNLEAEQRREECLRVARRVSDFFDSAARSKPQVRFTFYVDCDTRGNVSAARLAAFFKDKRAADYLPPVTTEDGKCVGFVVDVERLLGLNNCLGVTLEIDTGFHAAGWFPRLEVVDGEVDCVTLHKTGQPGETPLRDGACFKFPALSKQEGKA